MKLAVIDCGTNTFNLLILDIIDSNVQTKLFSTRESVKLGEGAIDKSFISEAAFDRAINAIKIFNKHLLIFEVDKVLAYATSAIRDASNGWQFIEMVQKQFNINIDVIDGLKEANLIFLGVNQAVKLNEKVSLIMDIGGGSVEFILAKQNQMIWKESFNIGAARILETFKPSNPIKQNEINAINHHFKEKLLPLSEAIIKYQPNELVGSSGAFESFIEMLAVKNLSQALVQETTEYDLNITDYFLLADEIIASHTEERKNMKGLVAMRVDMIVVTCMMLNFVLKEFNLKKMRVSTYSLKEGAVIDFINNRANN